MPVHASAGGLDFSVNAEFGHRGRAFVALFGDMSPPVGKVLGMALTFGGQAASRSSPLTA